LFTNGSGLTIKSKDASAFASQFGSSSTTSGNTGPNRQFETVPPVSGVSPIKEILTDFNKTGQKIGIYTSFSR